MGHVTEMELLDEKLVERASGNSKFVFKTGVNVLVGPNGSGKSTILQALIKQNKKDIKWRTYEGKGVDVLRMDFEKDNPRTLGYLHNDDRMHGQLCSMYMSHGETTRGLVDRLTRTDLKGKMVVMDEPDLALDFRLIIELVDIMEECDADQIITSAHSPFIILNPKFNKIELVPGYMDEVKERMKAIQWEKLD